MRLKTIGRHSVWVARGAARASVPVLRWGARRAAGGVIPEVPVPPPGRNLDLPGRGRTHVVDIPGPTADAPTVLLMHGIATTGSLTWFSVLAQLAARYRVVTFDQRWHGRGIRSDSFQLADCADDAAAVLDALGIERAVVVGYSMGGASAQMLWRRHPDRVAGLVLCSTAARWRGHLGERMFFLLLRVMNIGLLETAHLRVVAHGDGLLDPDHEAELREWAMAELKSTSPWALPVVLGELGRFDSTGWIGDAAVPTAVVITARDRAIPTARQRQLAAMIPHARVSEAPGGHTSLVFDLERWRPVFLDAVDHVIDQGRRVGAGSP